MDILVLKSMSLNDFIKNIEAYVFNQKLMILYTIIIPKIHQNLLKRESGNLNWVKMSFLRC